MTGDKVSRFVSGQASRQITVHVERHSPVIKHVTSRIAALGMLKTKTTAEITKFADGVESLTTIQQFSASGMEGRKEYRSTD